ncbi:MAG: sugar ABC transporter permease, partial [Dinoroseobacter sp.]|nr:sugar ABC transporter permease [Dinoroseobacter sp.]
MSATDPSATPPTGRGALQKREARLAWGLLFPTLAIVSLVVILPLLAIFWISFKPVGLADLRPTVPVVRESVRGSGDDLRLEFRVRNTSQEKVIDGVTLTDTLPLDLVVTEVPEPCTLTAGNLFCDFGTLESGFNERLVLPLDFDGDEDALEELLEGSEPVMTGTADNVLTNTEFTLENFARVFDGDEFWEVLWVTLFYTVFGTIGALVMGLFAAMLLN